MLVGTTEGPCKHKCDYCFTTTASKRIVIKKGSSHKRTSYQEDGVAVLPPNLQTFRSLDARFFCQFLGM